MLNPHARQFQPSAGSTCGSSATKTVDQRLVIIKAALNELPKKSPDGVTVVTRAGQLPARAAKESPRGSAGTAEVVAEVGKAPTDVGTMEVSGSGDNVGTFMLPSTAVRAARDNAQKSEEAMMAAGAEHDMARAVAESLREFCLN